jgi:hypothetical protein
MSTATAAPPADIAIAAAAREIFTRATGPGCEWPDAGAKAIGRAVLDLGDALEFYQLILAGELHPASAYEDLEQWQPEELRFAEALERAADEAMDAAREVTRVIGEHAGEQAAAYVSGIEGGQA